MASNTPLVISASRRTDLVSCYPAQLVETLAGFDPADVHTVVLWTKNPRNLLTAGPLPDMLTRFAQLYVHLTITGLGGTLLEPHIPPWPEVAGMLPGLVDLTGEPRRVSWRFDPLIRARTSTLQFDNFPLFGEIAAQVAACGITTCRTSWVEPYRKVQRRLSARHIELDIAAPEERRQQARELQTIAAPLGIDIFFCAMEGFDRSRCIDGERLTRLHPDARACSQARASGQRKLCGCTRSRDIGWYSQTCANGCLYCYAEPQLGPV